MAELRDWSAAADMNVQAPPDGWPEGMAYQAVNNTAREVMAVLARWQKDTSGELLTTGTSDALIVTPNGTYTSFSDGDRFSFTLHVDVNAGATLRVGPATNSAILLRDRHGELIHSDVLSQGDIADVVFRTNTWRLVSIANEVEGSLATTGDIKFHANGGAGSPPPGWLVCFGQAVSRTTYANLYAVIGDTWGAGDGSTTFNLPNFAGRMPRGTSSGLSVGDTGGSATHTLTISEMPRHRHTSTFETSNVTGSGGDTVLDSAGSGRNVQTSYQGSGNAHNNLPPYAAALVIIKT